MLYAIIGPVITIVLFVVFWWLVGRVNISPLGEKIAKTLLIVCTALWLYHFIAAMVG